MNENKDKLQKEAVQSWITENYKGTIVVGTGVGKTRIGLMAIKEIFDNELRIPDTEIVFKALIIVPTTNLRDNEWVQECTRWFPELLPYLNIVCIQTIYKQDPEYYDIVVLDEIHTTLSPKYRIIYKKNLSDRLLGLTATAPHIEEYKRILDKVCPIVFSLDREESVSLELISPSIIENVHVAFNKKEANKYRTYTKMFNTALIQLSSEGNAFDLAQRFKYDKTHPLHKAASNFWTGMTLRRWVCYRAEAKLKACVDIIKHVDRNKWIIFSHNTSFADDLTKELLKEGIFAVSYHSKMKSKERELVLEAAKSPLCKVICSAQALNTGYNLPDIDSAICVASTGTELTFIQELGRTSRLSESGQPKTSLFINILVEDTQEHTWIKNKLNVKKLTTKSVENFIKSYK